MVNGVAIVQNSSWISSTDWQAGGSAAGELHYNVTQTLTYSSSLLETGVAGTADRHSTNSSGNFTLIASGQILGDIVTSTYTLTGQITDDLSMNHAEGTDSSGTPNAGAGLVIGLDMHTSLTVDDSGGRGPGAINRTHEESSRTSRLERLEWGGTEDHYRLGQTLESHSHLTTDRADDPAGPTSGWALEAGGSDTVDSAYWKGAEGGLAPSDPGEVPDLGTGNGYRQSTSTTRSFTITASVDRGPVGETNTFGIVSDDSATSSLTAVQGAVSDGSPNAPPGDGYRLTASSDSHSKFSAQSGEDLGGATHAFQIDQDQTSDLSYRDEGSAAGGQYALTLDTHSHSQFTATDEQTSAGATRSHSLSEDGNETLVYHSEGSVDALATGGGSGSGTSEEGSGSGSSGEGSESGSSDGGPGSPADGEQGTGDPAMNPQAASGGGTTGGRYKTDLRSTRSYDRSADNKIDATGATSRFSVNSSSNVVGGVQLRGAGAGGNDRLDSSRTSYSTLTSSGRTDANGETGHFDVTSGDSTSFGAHQEATDADGTSVADVSEDSHFDMTSGWLLDAGGETTSFTVSSGDTAHSSLHWESGAGPNASTLDVNSSSHSTFSADGRQDSSGATDHFSLTSGGSSSTAGRLVDGPNDRNTLDFSTGSHADVTASGTRDSGGITSHFSRNSGSSSSFNRHLEGTTADGTFVVDQASDSHSDVTTFADKDPTGETSGWTMASGASDNYHLTARVTADAGLVDLDRFSTYSLALNVAGGADGAFTYILDANATFNSTSTPVGSGTPVADNGTHSLHETGDDHGIVSANSSVPGGGQGTGITSGTGVVTHGTGTPPAAPPAGPPSVTINPPPIYPDGGYDVVAVFDGGDMGNGHGDPHIASAGKFRNVADGYATSLDVRSFQDMLAKLTRYVEEHGKIDYLVVFDHGLSPAYVQEIGNDTLTSKRAALLRPLLSEDATIRLVGCHVGANPAYCHAIATAAGARVVANDDLVQITRTGIFWDYHGEGTWQTFIGGGSPP